MKIGGKGYYLYIVIDLFSRKIIGWHVSGKHDAEHTIAAFRKAYKSRHVTYGLLFHSDQGSEYTVFAFRQLLDASNRCL